MLSTHYTMIAIISQLQHPEIFNYWHVYHGFASILSHLQDDHTLLSSLHAGSRLVALPNFITDVFLSTIQKYKVTVVHMVPPLIQFLINHPSVENYDLSSINQITSASAPLSGELVTQEVVRTSQQNTRERCWYVAQTSWKATSIYRMLLKPQSRRTGGSNPYWWYLIFWWGLLFLHHWSAEGAHKGERLASCTDRTRGSPVKPHPNCWRYCYRCPEWEAWWSSKSICCEDPNMTEEIMNCVASKVAKHKHLVRGVDRSSRLFQNQYIAGKILRRLLKKL